MLKSEIKGTQKSASHNNLVQLQANQSLGLNNLNQLHQKVVAERTICYCSNFDLSLSEWVQMSENLKDFGENLLHELGKPNPFSSNIFPCRRAMARVV